MTTVRVVDDDESIAGMLRVLLEHDGLTVALTTRDFHNLLNPTLWNGVDTALIDLNLGGDITGISVLTYLRTEHPQIRRVVLSAITDISEAHLGDLADAALTKPSDFAEILRQVRL